MSVGQARSRSPPHTPRRVGVCFLTRVLGSKPARVRCKQRFEIHAYSLYACLQGPRRHNPPHRQFTCHLPCPPVLPCPAPTSERKRKKGKKDALEKRPRVENSTNTFRIHALESSADSRHFGGVATNPMCKPCGEQLSSRRPNHSQPRIVTQPQAGTGKALSARASSLNSLTLVTPGLHSSELKHVKIGKTPNN